MAKFSKQFLKDMAWRTENPAVLRKLADGKDVDILTAVAIHNNAPADVCDKLSDHPALEVAWFALTNKNTSQETLRRHANRPHGFSMQLAIARHKNTPPDALDILRKSDHTGVVRAVERRKPRVVESNTLRADQLIRSLLEADRVIPGVDEPDEFEPGTRPIPPHHIRFFHHTHTSKDPDAALTAIAQEGIRLSRAKGSTYGEPNAVWAATGDSTNHPGVRNHGSSFVEFHLAPDDPRLSGAIGAPDKWELKDWSPEKAREYEKRNYHVAIPHDITPDDIIAVHRHWHDSARKVMKNPKLIQRFKAGEYEWWAENNPFDRDLKPLHAWAKKKYGGSS